MTLDEAMRTACASVGIVPPSRIKVGEFVRTNTLERNGRGDATVLIFDDKQGGVAWNWQTQQQQRFTIRDAGQASVPRPRDLEKERQAEAERLEVERICQAIVRSCKTAQHPYLAAKGFPTEEMLVCDDPRAVLPDNDVGEMIAYALPKCEDPLLVIPGRIGKHLTTVQFITPEGEKVNIKRGQMSGAACRLTTGRETWVCEGIATALSVRDALRLLGRSATVLSAFAANNTAKVAADYPKAIIAADHDKPVETLGNLGTGEFYALKSGRTWTMPPERGDFNDMHQSEGIRAVALQLKGIGMG